MKLVSIPTEKTENGYCVDGDITMFFEFTDENYKKLLVSPIYDMYDFLALCEELSEDYWNLELFKNDDDHEMESIAFEHTTQTDINIFELLEMSN